MWAYAKPANTIAAGGYNFSSVWALTSTAGVSGTAGVSNAASGSFPWGRTAYDGAYFLFLQNVASACQTLSTLSGSTYSVSWFQAKRAGYDSPMLVVRVGASVLYNSTTVITSSSWYSPGSVSFPATASSMQLCFSNTISAGDATTLLDHITVTLTRYPTQPPPPPPRPPPIWTPTAVTTESQAAAHVVEAQVALDLITIAAEEVTASEAAKALLEEEKELDKLLLAKAEKAIKDFTEKEAKALAAQEVRAKEYSKQICFLPEAAKDHPVA